MISLSARQVNALRSLERQGQVIAEVLPRRQRGKITTPG
jgi:hypothetical protein